MIINPNNIEKWCFDYFEGNLTAHEQIEFERFILEHPEYHAEFEAWKNANESDDEKIPAYFGVEALIVGIPFYATWTFRVAVGTIIILSLGTLGYYKMNSLDGEREYLSHTNSVEMNWSPEDYKLAVVKFQDFAYGDYEVKTTITTKTSEVISYDYSNSNDNAGTLSNSNQNETDGSNELGDFNLEGSNLLSTEDGGNQSDKLLAFYEMKEIDQEDLYSEDYFWSESYRVDDKTLYDHLGINSSKYQFLNFNNSKVKGLGNNKYSYKNKNDKGDNHATITQSHQKGKSGSHKKKSHFFTNLKHLELGLTNINDPISLAPNYNTIGFNPALAGQLGVTRAKLSFRNQWWNTSASLYRGSFYLDTYIEKIQAGIAYGTEYDLTQDGKQSISKHSLSYVQKFSIAKGSNVSVGLTYELAKGENESVLPEMKEFYLHSPISSENIPSNWKSNLGISSWYSGKYFFGGINVTNLLGNTFIATHEENTSYINNLNLSVQLGTDYKRSIFAKTVLSPFVQYNKVGNYKDLWLGSVVRIKGLVLGGSVATSKSAKAMLGLQGNKLRFTLSSDYSKSMLLDKYAFSHEVSLRILLGNKNNNWSRYDN